MKEKRLRPDTPTPIKFVAVKATHLLQENCRIGRFMRAMFHGCWRHGRGFASLRSCGAGRSVAPGRNLTSGAA